MAPHASRSRLRLAVEAAATRLVARRGQLCGRNKWRHCESLWLLEAFSAGGRLQYQIKDILVGCLI
jgi:hypothetical protein